MLHHGSAVCKKFVLSKRAAEKLTICHSERSEESRLDT
jgi:hypothetical protein